MKMLAADSRLSYGVTLLRQAELATAWPFRRLRTITTILCKSAEVSQHTVAN